jgi:hypothetical protein
MAEIADALETVNLINLQSAFDEIRGYFRSERTSVCARTFTTCENTVNVRMSISCKLNTLQTYVCIYFTSVLSVCIHPWCFLEVRF